MELGFIKYDIVKILGTCPVQIMAVLFDPIENNGLPPDTWRFLYNFEVYHHRSIPTDLVTATAGVNHHIGTTAPDLSGNTYTNPKVIPTPANISVAAGVAAAAAASASSSAGNNNTISPSKVAGDGHHQDSVGMDSIYQQSSHGDHDIAMVNPLTVGGEQSTPMVGLSSGSSSPPPTQRRKSWLGRMTSSSHNHAH